MIDYLSPSLTSGSEINCGRTNEVAATMIEYASRRVPDCKNYLTLFGQIYMATGKEHRWKEERNTTLSSGPYFCGTQRRRDIF